MRMVRYASEDNWKEVISVVEDNKKPTNTMMFLRNVALMNEGGLLDRSFKLGNEPFDINNRDSIHVTLLDIASPLVYYNYGVMNEAIRLNFEMAIQAGFSPFYLKTLSRCAHAKRLLAVPRLWEMTSWWNAILRSCIIVRSMETGSQLLFQKK